MESPALLMISYSKSQKLITAQQVKGGNKFDPAHSSMETFSGGDWILVNELITELILIATQIHTEAIQCGGDSLKIRDQIPGQWSRFSFRSQQLSVGRSASSKTSLPRVTYIFAIAHTSPRALDVSNLFQHVGFCLRLNAPLIMDHGSQNWRLPGVSSSPRFSVHIIVNSSVVWQSKSDHNE